MQIMESVFLFPVKKLSPPKKQYKQNSFFSKKFHITIWIIKYNNYIDEVNIKKKAVY